MIPSPETNYTALHQRDAKISPAPVNIAVDQTQPFPPLELARALLLGFHPERDCKVYPYWIRRNNELIGYAIEVKVHTATRFRPLECLHVG